MAGLYLTKCISMQGVGSGMVSGGRGAYKGRAGHGVRVGRQGLAVFRFPSAAGASELFGVGVHGGGLAGEGGGK